MSVAAGVAEGVAGVIVAYYTMKCSDGTPCTNMCLVADELAERLREIIADYERGAPTPEGVLCEQRCSERCGARGAPRIVSVARPA